MSRSVEGSPTAKKEMRDDHLLLDVFSTILGNPSARPGPHLLSVALELQLVLPHLHQVLTLHHMPNFSDTLLSSVFSHPPTQRFQFGVVCGNLQSVVELVFPPRDVLLVVTWDANGPSAEKARQSGAPKPGQPPVQPQPKKPGCEGVRGPRSDSQVGSRDRSHWGRRRDGAQVEGGFEESPSTGADSPNRSSCEIVRTIFWAEPARMCWRRKRKSPRHSSF